MKQFLGLGGMLLVSSAGAMQPGDVAVHGHHLCKESTYQINTRHKPAPKLSVKIIPSKVKISDTSKKGTPLATVSVTWGNKAPFTGTLTLTKNPDGICQLAGMEVQLGRDTTKADDYRTLTCTVTATE
jgi:hypothetical protein